MEKQCKTLKELANEYNVHPITLRRWLLPIRKEIYGDTEKTKGKRYLLLPSQLEKIYNYLNNNREIR